MIVVNIFDELGMRIYNEYVFIRVFISSSVTIIVQHGDHEDDTQ